MYSAERIEVPIIRIEVITQLRVTDFFKIDFSRQPFKKGKRYDTYSRIHKINFLF
jgi:hypothetical protein